LRGSYFALKRILRCHPWAEPMVDPVPSPLKKPTPAVKVKG
jgi:putative component of membrane protein insertase Oxa1/YidC/SpoIIIJ protein YidD